MDPIDVLRKNRALIKRRFGVRRIGVFGSHARGGANPKSDVDVLVDFSRPTFRNFMGLADYLEELLGRRVDLVTVKGLSPYIAQAVKRVVVWCE
jgi:predicted nucleotidyltransferase